MTERTGDLPVLSEISPETTRYFTELGGCEASAVLIGQQIDLKKLTSAPIIRGEPIMTSLSGQGIALIYRYGAITFFNASVKESEELIAYCQPFTSQFFDKPETEKFHIKIDESQTEGIKKDIIVIQKMTKGHIEVIGDALSKSVILDLYEKKISQLFDKVEPIAKALTERGKLGSKAKELLQHIGATLLMAQNMVGKIEVSEKPNILWEQTHLEPISLHLAEDLELKEREVVLHQKMDLISKTAETSLGVLEHRHSNRLEWYIIILIAIEIGLQLYEMFF